MASENQTTPEPGRLPCERCGASREDQVSTSYYSEDHKALCTTCWTAAYGDPWTNQRGVVSYDY